MPCSRTYLTVTATMHVGFCYAMYDPLLLHAGTATKTADWRSPLHWFDKPVQDLTSQHHCQLKPQAVPLAQLAPHLHAINIIWVHSCGVTIASCGVCIASCGVCTTSTHFDTHSSTDWFSHSHSLWYQQMVLACQTTSCIVSRHVVMLKGRA